MRRSWLSIRPDTRVRLISATRCIAAALAAIRRNVSSPSVNAGKSIGIFFFDKRRGHVTADEFRMIHHRRQERQVVADAFDLETVQRHAHRLDCALARVGAQVHSLAIIGS